MDQGPYHYSIPIRASNRLRGVASAESTHAGQAQLRGCRGSCGGAGGAGEPLTGAGVYGLVQELAFGWTHGSDHGSPPAADDARASRCDAASVSGGCGTGRAVQAATVSYWTCAWVHCAQ